MAREVPDTTSVDSVQVLFDGVYLKLLCNAVCGLELGGFLQKLEFHGVFRSLDNSLFGAVANICFITKEEEDEEGGIVKNYRFWKLTFANINIAMNLKNIAYAATINTHHQMKSNS